MSDFPGLSDFLSGHLDVTENSIHPECTCGWEQNDDSGVGPYWRDHIEAAWRKACAIGTVEQLQDLPKGCVIRGLTGAVFEKFADARWYPSGFGRSVPVDRLNTALPARLLWHPEWVNA
jgi:hypothetical protein